MDAKQGLKRGVYAYYAETFYAFCRAVALIWHNKSIKRENSLIMPGHVKVG